MIFHASLYCICLKSFEIKSQRPLPASLYCICLKDVELYTTMKWKTMDINILDFGMTALIIWDQH